MWALFALAGVYLPPTHWAYDALASLASRGLVGDAPAWLFKDWRFLYLPSTHLRRDPATGYRTWNHASRLVDRRLLTREQAAKLVARALEAAEREPERISDRERGLLRALCEEFERELEEEGIGRSWWQWVLRERGTKAGFGVQATLGAQSVNPGRDVSDLVGRALVVAARSNRENGPDGRRFLSALGLDFGVGKGREGEFKLHGLWSYEFFWGRRKIALGQYWDRLWWGPGKRGSLLFGGLFPPKRPFYGLSYRFKALGERISLRATAAGLGGGRYLLAHRLGWSPSPDLSVGVSEAFIKHGSPGPLAWLATCLPLPITGASTLTGEEGNAIVSFDAAYDEGKGVGMWGELLIDDFIWRKGETGDNEFGLLLGARFYDHKKPLRNFLLLEYARTDRLTYWEKRPEEEPKIGPHWLGHWIGPDAQDFFVQASYEVAPRLTLSAAIEYTDYEISRSQPERIRRREQVRTLEAAYTLRPDLVLRLTYQGLSRYGAATPGESQRRLTLAVEGYF